MSCASWQQECHLLWCSHQAKVTRSAGRGEVRAERGSRLNLKETGSFLSGEHGTESSLSRLTAPLRA
ncbi:hypothetical protein Q8A67_018280 [Cirrhinus molitorella]|uniref:Uncharacterized protein n=1 Tax=Cirrhinus molitorella TaxID=172907 RepID=A0AA88P8U4_9TELE|nr:hypothetical protein Q8A67_018280 [Cirrhinus molitorella]